MKPSWWQVPAHDTCRASRPDPVRKERPRVSPGPRHARRTPRPMRENETCGLAECSHDADRNTLAQREKRAPGDIRGKPSRCLDRQGVRSSNAMSHVARTHRASEAHDSPDARCHRHGPIVARKPLEKMRPSCRPGATGRRPPRDDGARPLNLCARAGHGRCRRHRDACGSARRPTDLHRRHRVGHVAAFALRRPARRGPPHRHWRCLSRSADRACSGMP